MSDGLLIGKVGIVTGSSKGIGSAIAELFLSQGARVYAVSRTAGDLGEKLADLNKTHKAGEIIPVYMDLRDQDAVKQLILKIRKEEKSLDFLINNAGLVSYELLAFTDYDKMREMFEVNVVCAVQLIQAVSRIMSKQKSGAIVNISSLVGSRGAAGQLSYSATKGALISVTKSAAKELSNKQIRVNAIAPGMVGTERFTKVFSEKFADKLKDIGFGRLAKPEEIANACLFLASDLSEYITGQVIEIDGDSKI
jgi:3-oxoacyl-[acyl-carrier protein] reductase